MFYKWVFNNKYISIYERKIGVLASFNVTEIVSVARLTIKALICGAALHNLGRHMMDERTLTIGHNPGHHVAVGCDLISNSV